MHWDCCNSSLIKANLKRFSDDGYSLVYEDNKYIEFENIQVKKCELE